MSQTRKSRFSSDDAFALLQSAAIAGDRCPQAGIHGFSSLTSAVTTALAHAGRIRIEIYAWNFRVIEILTGPHAGKRTAPGPNGQKPWKIIDANGTRTRRGTVNFGRQGRSQPSAPRPLTREELAS